MIILDNLVNTGQRMEQKNMQILMKDNEQKTIQSLRSTGK